MAAIPIAAILTATIPSTGVRMLPSAVGMPSGSGPVQECCMVWWGCRLVLALQ